MKRIREEDQILGGDKFIDFQSTDKRNEKTGENLRKNLTLQIEELDLDDLYFIRSLVEENINRKSSVIICNMIPNDVWVLIFQILSNNQDISIPFSLRLVCKSWENIFSDFPLQEATVINSTSVSSLLSLPTLQTLKINLILIQHLEQLFKAETLNNFISLKKLDVKQVQYNGSEFRIMVNIRHLMLNCLQQFEKVSLPFNSRLFDFFEFQKKYPQIRFRWYSRSSNPSVDKNDNSKLNYYEGDIKQSNVIEGKGIYTLWNGERYEGEWKNGKKSGKGIYYFKSSIYDGEWKDSKMEGHGTETHFDGSRYEGEWRDGKKNGVGNYYYANGDRFEGRWSNGKKEGEGVYHSKISGRYEGGWKDNKKNGAGTEFYPDGRIYEGIWKDGIITRGGKFISGSQDLGSSLSQLLGVMCPEIDKKKES